MRFFNKCKDGGTDSSTTAYFLFEIKKLGSVALLRFDKGGRDTYHTHAFNAWTWFICGNMYEEEFNGDMRLYKQSWKPKKTLRTKNHRVIARKTSWALTVRGPWVDTWTEDDETHTSILTNGRKVIAKNKRK